MQMHPSKKCLGFPTKEEITVNQKGKKNSSACYKVEYKVITKSHVR